MAVMDEFKEERAKVKGMPLYKRIGHFWYYHKSGILVMVFALFVIGIGVFSAVINKETAVYVALVDCVYDGERENNITEYEAILAERLGINVNTQEVALDAVMAREATVNGILMNDGLLDLREYMTPEQYEYYKDSLYWIDYNLVAAYELNFDKGWDSYGGNHRSPEGMKYPMPVGVYLTPGEEFQEYYTFLYEQEVVFAPTFSKREGGTKKALEVLDILAGRESD